MDINSTVKVREDYFIVSSGKSINRVCMEAKIRRTYDESGREVSREKLDSVSFEIARNWGNKIYMNRATGNKLYLAFVRGLVKAPCSMGVLDSFETIREITAYLDSIGAEYCVGRELTAN